MTEQIHGSIESIRESKIQVLGGMVFGSTLVCRLFQNAVNRSGCDWPMAFISTSQEDPSLPGGAQFFLTTSGPPARIHLFDRVVASVDQREYADFCFIAGLLPENPRVSSETQTVSVLRQLQKILNQAGMDMTHLVRTWFYNKKITTWYDTFNRVRTAFYSKTGVLQTLIPASTGMGGGNLEDADLTACAFAVKPKDRGVQIAAVDSPLQNPALEYGSAFSRAVTLKTPEFRRLIVSGTASISDTGETLFPESPQKQIERTLDVVAALLHKQDFTFADVTRAVLYLKHQQHLPVLRQILQDRSIRLPAAPIVINDICRDELLFEIEVDAQQIFNTEKG